MLAGFLIASVVITIAFNPGKTENRVSHLPTPPQGIQFIENDWDKAMTLARQENKLIFLDAYASWCGPCKLLKARTFPDKAAGDFFNKNFVNVAIDMEKGDGPMLREKFNVTGYPTLIITDHNGKVITQAAGYIGPSRLITLGKQGLQGKR